MIAKNRQQLIDFMMELQITIYRHAYHQVPASPVHDLLVVVQSRFPAPLESLHPP